MGDRVLRLDSPFWAWSDPPSERDVAAARRRAEVRGSVDPSRHEPAVEAALREAWRSGAFDLLLDETRARDWRDEVLRLEEVVTARLAETRPGADTELIREYVAEAAHRWFLQSSIYGQNPALVPYLQTVVELRGTQGWWRDGARADATGDSFHPTRQGHPSLVLKEFETHVMIEAIGWGRDRAQGFLGKWAALTSSGRLQPIDDDLFSSGVLPEHLVPAVERVARSYREMRAAWRYGNYQRGQHRGHLGQEPFPRS